MSSETLDAVVIGAGLAGLTAARRLREAGKRVVVLEARDRVGGRTSTVDLAGDPVDLGGQWIGPTQDRVRALAGELGVRTFPQHHRGRKLIDLAGEHRTYRGLLPRLRLAALFDLGVAIERIEWMARSVPLDDPTRARKAAAWDRISAGDWLRAHVRTPEARKVLEIATHAIFAAEPDALSLLYFLFYARSGRSFTRLAQIPGGAQQERFVGGAQQLSEGLRARVGEQHVLLDSPVTALSQDGERVVVRTPRTSLAARLAVLAVPPALADGIAFAPALPPERAELHRSMPMGSVIKCVVAYERAFWREQGLSGEAISDGEPVRAVFDDCSHDDRHPALLCFILGDVARRFSALPEPERRAAVVAHLVRLFGEQAASPRAYVDKDWISDPWSTGCYVGLMGPGLLTRVGQALRRPVGRLHFAGTETAVRWCGYLDGAIESGERAAAELLARLA